MEGVDCVPVMLDGTLEVSFMCVLGGVVVSGMVGRRFVRYIVRGMRIYCSQDHMCRVLKNVRGRSIRSVSEGCGVMVLLWRCEVSRVRVCEIVATFLASADVKASLVCGCFKRLEW